MHGCVIASPHVNIHARCETVGRSVDAYNYVAVTAAVVTLCRVATSYCEIETMATSAAAANGELAKNAFQLAGFAVL